MSKIIGRTVEAVWVPYKKAKYILFGLIGSVIASLAIFDLANIIRIIPPQPVGSSTGWSLIAYIVFLGFGLVFSWLIFFNSISYTEHLEVESVIPVKESEESKPECCVKVEKECKKNSDKDVDDFLKPKSSR